MFRKVSKLLTLIVLIPYFAYSQSFQSPEQFFGHPMGSRFHFHHQLIDYVKYVANTKTSITKLIPYGTTTEGRPLMVLAIGSEKNIADLEKIREANLQNIGLRPGGGNAQIPAIAYFSYNVHGNEANNAETAISVIYELTREGSEIAKKIFGNTIVLIDPCVNPDGFDRYSQWYNRYIGTHPDLKAAAVEHHEPWPGGRFNHYLFDMNRDVAWQTQNETSQRVKFYNSWMPHLHADFHEMGPNTHYYFPPSAKPFHEDLTAYQRDFQTLLGEYNKKRFDENGWLYYTKENYDLLYPSYGDTYPSYNGAIGMTFEQAGGGPAGVAFKRNDGDVLTLKDRIDHSFATSMGTLEALSDKAESTVKEFNRFFNETTQKGFGKYKTYILKYAGNESKIEALGQQLDKMEIKYEFASKKTVSNGFNYQNQKEEAFAVEENDMIVSSFQSKGVFAKILFEPKTMLEDSNTYDITAWALPYVFDIQAYAIPGKMSGNTKPETKTPAKIQNLSKVYAFLVDYKSFKEAQYLAALLKNKVKVRTNESPFKAAGKSFKEGTLIITRKGNDKADFETIPVQIAEKMGINLVPVYSGLSESGPDLGANSIDIVKAPDVAVIMGAGVSATAAGDVWHFFDKQLDYPVTIIDGSYIGSVDLWKFDVLILPSGRYNNIFKDTKELSRWVSDGGRLILMESAVSGFAGKEGFDLKAKAEESSTSNKDQKYGNRERDAISDQIPGAIYKVGLDATHPLAYGYDSDTYVMIKNVIGYDYLKDGWNVGKLQERVSGFAGAKTNAKMKDVPVFAVQDSGKGKIIYLNESPIFRAFWYGGKQLMANAAFMVR